MRDTTREREREREISLCRDDVSVMRKLVESLLSLVPSKASVAQSVPYDSVRCRLSKLLSLLKNCMRIT